MSINPIAQNVNHPYTHVNPKPRDVMQAETAEVVTSLAGASAAAGSGLEGFRGLGV